MISRDRALALLSECTGDEIWSLEHCRLRRVPPVWIEQLADTYESGFAADSQTIYHQQRVTNQYHGIRDVDLAVKLGEALGVDIPRATDTALNRAAVVRAIKEAVMDD